MLSKLKELYFGFILVLFAIVLIVKWDEVKELFILFTAQTSVFLLIAVLMQVFTYIVTALTYKSLLETMGSKVPFKFLFKSSFTMQSLNHIVPSLGFSGAAFFVSKTKKFGVSAGNFSVSCRKARSNLPW